jgi:hypothetical protein
MQHISETNAKFIVKKSESELSISQHVKFQYVNNSIVEDTLIPAQAYFSVLSVSLPRLPEFLL